MQKFNIQLIVARTVNGRIVQIHKSTRFDTEVDINIQSHIRNGDKQF